MQIVVHYHEIALKGKNRNVFVKQLVSNIRKTFKDMGKIAVRTLFGRITFSLDTDNIEEIHRRMTGVFGAANYSVVYETAQDFDAICQAAWRCVTEAEGRTICVRCRRADKEFPKHTLEMEREVGAYILRTGRESGRPLKVNLTSPDITVHLEIVSGTALVSGERFKGPGGLPTGTGGRVVGLLSSGFDSPVACWHMMKRGAEVIMCHFHSYPFTNKASLENCRELAAILTRYQLRSKVYLVGFAPVQEEILSVTPADMRMILYRRSMIRIAQKAAAIEHAEALVTGESLGQVASQTLTNMAVIDEASHMPMLRPVVGADKEEIMTKARDIGTYELSSRPYEDCCSLMLAQHPVTKASLAEVKALEEIMELEDLEEKAIENAEVLRMEWKDGQVVTKVLQEPVYKDYPEGACLIPGSPEPEDVPEPSAEE